MTVTEEKTESVWGRGNLTTTLGVFLLVVLLAFESMGFATALPTMVADLHGQRLYSWPFTAFLAAQVLATVLGGRWCDRRGPTAPLLIGPVVFGVGLLLSGSAPSMAMLLVGRTAQGLGAGISMVAVMVLIASVYPDRLRPKVFAATAAAWVLPAVLGPPIAGALTQWLSWRWVFFALVPLVVIALSMLYPAVRALPPHTRPATNSKGTVLPAFGAAVGIAGVTWAAQHPSLLALSYGVPAMIVLALAVRRALPTGTLRARAGLPVVVLSRGLLAGATASVAAFLPLTLTVVHGYSPTAAGLPLTVFALGWSASSMWQGRHVDVPRHRLLSIGFALASIGLLGILAVTPSWGPAWLSFPTWTITGLGMGLAMPTVSVLVMRLSPPEQLGKNNSALQLSDAVGTALLIGIGGVLLNTIASPAHPSLAVAVLIVAMIALTTLGSVLARRAR